MTKKKEVSTNDKAMQYEPLLCTVIQLMTETPYKQIAKYDFLYMPLSQDVKLKIDSKEYSLMQFADRIDEQGNITRYVRFH
jgi:hypothetical protein